MSITIDSILTHRRRVAARSSRLGIWASLAVHAGFVAAIVATPLLAPTPSEPMRFVSVALVSAQALGVRDPEPAPARVEPRSAPPEPAPTPPKPKATTTQPKPQATAPAKPTPAPPDLRRREGSPTGSSTGTAALGARVGFDNPNFKHSYYVDRLTAMLAGQWERPALGGEIASLVSFTIRKDGSVSDIHVVESSGYSSYDLAALRAVQQAAPFPPLPQSYDRDSLGVTVEFI